MESRNQASILRAIADELDPPVQPDVAEVPLIEVKLLRDGVPFELRLVPVPCIGDGIWGAFSHDGEVVFTSGGVPERRVKWQLTIKRTQ